ncbi:MAG: IucA/IucC family C-terminal-domain containing protein [Acidimicrobiales bacterium]
MSPDCRDDATPNEESRVTLRGDAGRARLRDALAEVANEWPYLRAAVEPTDEFAHEGDDLDGRWLSGARLVDDPDWLAYVMDDCGRRLGSDDPTVAASLFVQNYAYRIVTLALACAMAAGVLPASSAAATAVVVRNGRPTTVGYLAPVVTVLAPDAASATHAWSDDGVRDAALAQLLDSAVAHHLAPLVANVRQCRRVGEPLLWGNVASSAAVGFRTMEGRYGSWVRDVADRFFALAPAPLQGRGSFLALESGGRRGWYWERRSCCLYDRLPGAIRCADCSRTPSAARREAYRAQLASDAT